MLPVIVSLMAACGASADGIDDYVTAEMAARRIPGIAVLVMRGGAVVKKQGYGFANVELAVPVTPETMFQSGSTGKQFTAAGILLLAEDGKLGLDDPLSRHFPGSPATWRRITIRQLLTHTSGIKDYSVEFDYRKDYTDEEMLAVMQSLPLDFEPGTQWNYSNSGYLILGLLTTKLAGKHWSEFQAERLFAPLGMKTTRVISERDIVIHRAAGYEHDDNGDIVNQEWVAPSFNRCADGALYFSLKDLEAWETALDARAFMSPESFTTWWTPAKPLRGSRYPYGFGWFLSEQRGEPVVEHDGSWQGFRANITRYPEQRLAVVVLSNDATAMPEEMSHRIAGIVEPTLRMRSAEAVATSEDATLVGRLRAVLEAWSAGRVTPEMAPGLASIPADNPQEATDRRRAAERLKAVRTFRILGEDPLSEPATMLLGDDSVRAVDLLLETDHAAWIYRIRLDALGRIVNLLTER
jgi:D-alanyl-D-alanine carboxypeptidase